MAERYRYLVVDPRNYEELKVTSSPDVWAKEAGRWAAELRSRFAEDFVLMIGEKWVPPTEDVEGYWAETDVYRMKMS